MNPIKNNSKKNSKKIFLSIFLFFASTSISLASPLGFGGGSQNITDIEIEADQGIEWLSQEQKYVARGNVLAKRGVEEIRTDALFAHYNTTSGALKIHTLEAIGNVRIRNGEASAVTEKAILNIPQEYVQLSGKNTTLQMGPQTLQAQETVSFWGKELRGKAIGKAQLQRTLTDGSLQRLEAEEIEAFFQKDSTGKITLQKATATKNLHLTNGNEKITGDSGTYDMVKNHATIRGNVILQRGNSTLMGNYAEINLATGHSRLIADSTGGTKGRVRGVFRLEDFKRE